MNSQLQGIGSSIGCQSNYRIQVEPFCLSATYCKPTPLMPDTQQFALFHQPSLKPICMHVPTKQLLCAANLLP